MNVDGSFTSKDNIATCGGVVRDNNGVFIVDFCVNLGKYCVLHVELWGIIHGLKLAARGFSRILIESDSELAIRFLDKDCHPSNPSAPLVREINSLIENSPTSTGSIF